MIQRFVRLQRVKGKHAVEVAARHNLREIAAEYGGKIDPARVHLNRVLFGAAKASDVAKAAADLLAGACIHALRKDAVRALEVIVSLPGSADVPLQDKVFLDAVGWAQRYFGAPLLSAVIHRDEAAPHCHILILPLVDGRMQGSALYGYKSKLRAMLDNFDAHVGRPNGLRANDRATAPERRQMIEQAFATLQANSGLQDDVLAALLKPHYADPSSLAEILHLPRVQRHGAVGEFVKTMTKPGKTRSAKKKRDEFVAIEIGGGVTGDNLKAFGYGARE